MKKFSRFIVLFPALTAFCQAPIISVSPDTIDFKTRNEGDTIHARFIIKNNGDAPLIIRDYKSDCGCTIPKLAKDTILSGDSAELLAQFHTLKYTGDITRSIHLNSNDPINGFIPAVIRGCIISHFTVNHHKIYFRHTQESAQEFKRKIIITNVSDKPRVVHKVVIPGKDFKTNLGTGTFPCTIQPKTALEFDLFPSARLLRSRENIKSRLTIATDSPINRLFEIPVFWFHSKTDQDSTGIHND